MPERESFRLIETSGMPSLTLADALHNLPYSFERHSGAWISSFGIGIASPHFWDY
jgi:hypothetical protein